MRASRLLSRVSLCVFFIYTVYVVWYAVSLPGNDVISDGDSVMDPNVNDLVPKNRLWSPWPAEKQVKLEDIWHKANITPKVVEIWGKAAIGQYFWEHVLGGKVTADNELMNSGSIVIRDIEFKYISGPGYGPSTVNTGVENLVLVLNGREPDKVNNAKIWLDSVRRMPRLRKLAVVLLGNEKCNSHWMKEYEKVNGGVIDLHFIVYDSNSVDDRTVFQWPLGVATYRSFPLEPKVDLDSNRRYVCNFAGTVYTGSSRENLMEILNREELKSKCTVLPRYKWQTFETELSASMYIDMLKNSDLTLCPVGLNTECYRIYEAMSLGSVPVIEDVRTPGLCAEQPLRLLKKYKAPVIYVKSWDELPKIIAEVEKMTNEEKLKKRRRVVKWYRLFRLLMKERFSNAINRTFFGA